MLEIVEHEQQRALAQVGEHVRFGCDSPGGREVERRGNCRSQVRHIGDRGQGDHGHPIGKDRTRHTVRNFGGNLEGQAGLAEPPRADQCHEPASWSEEFCDCRLPLGLPPDQRARRPRQLGVALCGRGSFKAMHRRRRGRLDGRARHTQEGRPLVLGDAEDVGEALGHGARGAAQATLEGADRLHRAADSLGQELLGQVILGARQA
jgi:hypothetical protein